MRRVIWEGRFGNGAPAVGLGAVITLGGVAWCYGAIRSLMEFPPIRPISRLLISLCILFLSQALFQSAALAQCANAANGPRETMGCWSDTLSNWPLVAIHAHLLPDGTYLTWGRVEQSLADNATIWDPTYPWDFTPGADNSGASTDAHFPAVNTNYDTNLFCSGHTFLPDGRLLVVGGHVDFDGDGLNATQTFGDDTWINHPNPMNDGRWYPTVTALPQAPNNAPRALVVSGVTAGNLGNNLEAQVWQEGVGWTTIGYRPLPNYPFMHLAGNGDVFNSGPNVDTKFLDLVTGWEAQTFNQVYGSSRSYGSSVMYDDDKILVMGGANPPTDTAVVIDLSL